MSSSSRRVLNRALHRLRNWVEVVAAIHPDTDAADRFGRFGRGSCIAFPAAALFGESAIHLGENTLVGRHCSLSVGYSPDQDDLPERGLVIGDRCVIGARTTITAHESVVIGDDVWFGQSVFISDASHGYQDPGMPIGLQLGRHQPVSIGSGSWIGNGAVILPGATVGRHVVVGAGSVVRGHVEDHAVVAGVPARTVRRYVPEVGWIATDGSGEVRPPFTAAEVEAVLTGA
ncbi:acyltransferase [Nocardioides houyundeii]|uniref:acyltransferase n=1 Tax=Nocardioides houyundeii TaxID=2045452 RepID=UPI002410DDBD|nr:acyltransferase [Nocardioides houyundeii]